MKLSWEITCQSLDLSSVSSWQSWRHWSWKSASNHWKGTELEVWLLLYLLVEKPKLCVKYHHKFLVSMWKITCIWTQSRESQDKMTKEMFWFFPWHILEEIGKKDQSPIHIKSFFYWLSPCFERRGKSPALELEKYLEEVRSVNIYSCWKCNHTKPGLLFMIFVCFTAF